MIESLHNSHSRFLVSFAIWTYFIAAAVGFMAPLTFATKVEASAADTARALRASLEASASQVSSLFAAACVILLILSWAVLARVLIKSSYGTDEGVVRLLAKSVFVLSMLMVVGTISAAVCCVVLYS